jgi:hypothetical protein
MIDTGKIDPNKPLSNNPSIHSKSDNGDNFYFNSNNPDNSNGSFKSV